MIRKMNLSKKDRSREGVKYISRIPPNELAGVDFVDYGGDATFLHMQDTLSLYAMIIFIGNRAKKKTADKVAKAVSASWASFSRGVGYYCDRPRFRIYGYRIFTLL